MEMKMATSKDFVDAVVNKNNLEAEDAFKAAIQTKVGDALEAKRKEVATESKRVGLENFMDEEDIK